MINIRHPVSPI